MIYAASALNEHNFQLKETLHILTKEQQDYIYNILMKCLNRTKIERVISELKEM